MLNSAKNWTPNQLKLIFWLATPKAHRKPATQQELASDIGVTEVTVSRWANKPELTTEVNRVARAELGKDLPEVYATLRKLAIKGSFQHMKLYLELLEEYSEEVNVNVRDEREHIRGELDELAKRRAGRAAS